MWVLRSKVKTYGQPMYSRLPFGFAMHIMTPFLTTDSAQLLRAVSKKAASDVEGGLITRIEAANESAKELDVHWLWLEKNAEFHKHARECAKHGRIYDPVPDGLGIVVKPRGDSMWYLRNCYSQGWNEVEIGAICPIEAGGPKRRRFTIRWFADEQLLGPDLCFFRIKPVVKCWGEIETKLFSICILEIYVEQFGAAYSLTNISNIYGIHRLLHNRLPVTTTPLDRRDAPDYCLW